MHKMGNLIFDGKGIIGHDLIVKMKRGIEMLLQGFPPITANGTAKESITALTVYGHSTQDGTPSPENPVPIVSAGSVMTTGAQLFDKNNVTTGYITDNLIVVKNENWIISDFINCNENQNVCISQENNIFYQFRVCFYNSEKVATSIANYEGYVILYVFSIPENAKYFKISYSVFVNNESVDRGKIMVNYGSTALPWEPYTGGIPGANPYEGEIGVEVSDGGTQSQTLTLSTPGGLPGIPVTSGGNYTDESGQQWICDEIDLARGKYVQRVAIEQKNGDFRMMESSDEPGRYYQYSVLDIFFKDGSHEAFCNIASWVLWGKDGAHTNTNWLFALNSNGCYISPPSESGITTADELNAFLNSLSFPVVFVGQLETPIETDLPAEEIAAYKALHTYSPTTTVSNDAAAWMEVGVIME